jgi:hypothetical protein
MGGLQLERASRRLEMRILRTTRNAITIKTTPATAPIIPMATVGIPPVELSVLVLLESEVPVGIGALDVGGVKLPPIDTTSDFDDGFGVGVGVSVGVGVGVGTVDEEDLEVDELLDLEVGELVFAVVGVRVGVVDVLGLTVMPSNDVNSSKGSNTWRFWN